MNVLSLFDGMSCGQIALERAGIKVDNYYASEVDKYAIAVTMYNYPNTVQLGDITKIKGSDLPKIDLLIGGSPCFIAGTPIICRDTIKNIEDVKVGDRVLTHRGKYQSVIKIGGDTKDTYSLLAQGNTLSETTKEHPYFIRKRHKVWNNENRTYECVFKPPTWVKVKDIEKGDYVGTPILKSNDNPYNLTEDECFVIGLYIGDGHTRKDYRASENRSNDRHWQPIISVGSHEINKFTNNVNIKHSKSVHRAVFSNKRLVEVVEENCRCGAGNKTLSKMILDLPIKLLKRVLDGYEFADGSYRDNTYRATTISKSLVQSISLAVAKIYRTTCSIEYTHRPETTIIEGRTVNQKNTWTISYRKHHTKQSRAWVIDDIVWNPIKRIEKTGDVKSVYNLEVESDNSYIANGHIVHNCQGFSFAGKQLNFDDPRSKLFFEYARILKECRKKNLDIKFMLENVRMKKENQDIISEYLGVKPIKINSSLVSAQNRVRLYWTNIKGIQQPDDKGILLIDIIEKGFVDRDKSYCVDANYMKGGNLKSNFLNCRRQLVFKKNYVQWDLSGKGYNSQDQRAYYLDGKHGTLPSIGASSKVKVSIFEKPHGWNKGGIKEKDKFGTLRKCTNYNYAILDKDLWRKLTVTECERLQTVPDDYTLVPWQKRMMSNSQRYKMLGNGWTVDVIAHIFKGLA